MKFKIWLKAIRAPFFTATIIPVVLGSIIAWHDVNTFLWPRFWLVMLGILLMHTGTNLTNDYFDHKTKNDELNLNHTPVSGGSRVIQDGLIPSNMILYVALASFLAASIIGLYLAWRLESAVILILGIIGVFCGFFYTAFPLKIGYRGLGETIVGLCFGPLVVFGSYYVQAGKFSLTPILASIPVGLLILLVLYINEFPDREADEMVGKKTLVVLLGKGRAIRVLHLFLTMLYIYTFICILFGALPIYATIVLFTLPFAFKIYSVSKANYFRVNELLPANFAMIGLHFSFGFLLIVSFALDKLL